MAKTIKRSAGKATAGKTVPTGRGQAQAAAKLAKEDAVSKAIREGLRAVREASAANDGAHMEMLRLTAKHRAATLEEVTAEGWEGASAKSRASEFNVGARAAEVLGDTLTLATINAAADKPGRSVHNALKVLREAIKAAKAEIKKTGRKLSMQEREDIAATAMDSLDAAAPKRTPKAGKAKAETADPVAALAFCIAQAMDAARAVPAADRKGDVGKAITALSKAFELAVKPA